MKPWEASPGPASGGGGRQHCPTFCQPGPLRRGGGLSGSALAPRTGSGSQQKAWASLAFAAGETAGQGLPFQAAGLPPPTGTAAAAAAAVLSTGVRKSAGQASCPQGPPPVPWQGGAGGSEAASRGGERLEGGAPQAPCDLSPSGGAWRSPGPVNGKRAAGSRPRVVVCPGCQAVAGGRRDGPPLRAGPGRERQGRAGLGWWAGQGRWGRGRAAASLLLETSPSPSSLPPVPSPRLTDGGDQSAAEEEGGGEVPVGRGGRGVVEEGHAVAVGAQDGAQEALEGGLRQARAVLQEGRLQLPHLGPQPALVGPLDGRDDQRAQQQVAGVAQREERQQSAPLHGSATATATATAAGGGREGRRAGAAGAEPHQQGPRLPPHPVSGRRAAGEPLRRRRCPSPSRRAGLAGRWEGPAAAAAGWAGSARQRKGPREPAGLRAHLPRGPRGTGTHGLPAATGRVGLALPPSLPGESSGTWRQEFREPPSPPQAPAPRSSHSAQRPGQSGPGGGEPWWPA